LDGGGGGVSPSQSHCLRTKQHKHRINAHNTKNHAVSAIRTHEPSVRASEDNSCLTSRGSVSHRKSWTQANHNIRNCDADSAFSVTEIIVSCLKYFKTCVMGQRQQLKISLLYPEL
jgi:hypothetical protein